MCRQASLNVALGGSAIGSRLLAISDIFLMVRPSARATEPGYSLKIDRFYLDEAGINLPIANGLGLGELLLRRFDRLFSIRRRSNDDRSLAAAKELIVSGNFVYAAHAIARHPSRSQSLRHHGEPISDMPE
jgi:hypothetical protein